MSILEETVAHLDGTPASLGELTRGKPALLVNVASKCGLTPQYAGLERVQRSYADRLTVIGFPCNQFLGQEPGTSEEIAEFCSSTYGVSFPMTEKIEVNGAERHPIFRALVTCPNEDNETGDVSWNFEKFLLDADGSVKARFSPSIEPEDPRILTAIEALTG